MMNFDEAARLVRMQERLRNATYHEMRKGGGHKSSEGAVGQDRYGRTLATIRINGTDVGDILIAEGLARRWPDGHEWWCN